MGYGLIAVILMKFWVCLFAEMLDFDYSFCRILVGLVSCVCFLWFVNVYCAALVL